MSFVTPSQQEYHERWKAARGRLRLVPTRNGVPVEIVAREVWRKPVVKTLPFTSSDAVVDVVEEIERAIVLAEIAAPRPPRMPKIAEVQAAVCKHFGISKLDFLSQRRTRKLARPRQIAMYLAKTMTPHSLPEIGRRFGGRDHSTVVHAVKRIEELRTADPQMAADIEAVKAMLRPVE